MTDVRDEAFMREALRLAQQAAAQGEVPVGAVVVRDGQVIARAHNAPVADHDPTAHAEIRALRVAAQRVGNYRLEDCTLYVTLEPCAMCSGAILQARLPRVVFGAAEPRTGAAGSVVDVFRSPLNHQTQVTSGVLAQACADVLQDFFAERRVAQQQARVPLREDALRTPQARFVGLDLPLEMSHYASDWPVLDGWRLHWFDNRSAAVQGRATLYLHGPDQWSAAYVDALRADAPALALDLLGFGLSDKPKKEAAYSVSLHARVLAEFLARHSVAGIVAPPSVAPVLQALGTCDVPVQWCEAPTLNPVCAQAPYPDSGHEAGRRAWRTI